MSSTSTPITPEHFLAALQTLDLPQLHAESARLQLSLYHLHRSQVALEEFADDPVCKVAMEDNEVVIRRQMERVEVIRAEVERRGFSIEHGVEGRVNGVGGGEGERGRRMESQAQRQEQQEQEQQQQQEEEEEEGVYL